jgi:LuxR family maltose regulon positive regulatory protein
VAGDRQKVDLSSSGLVGTLTKKELATLALLVEGLSNREISDRLCVSTNTVKTHLKSAYGKLGVSRRTQAVRCLKRLGIFE